MAIYSVASSTDTTLNLTRSSGGAVIIYGRGADLGSFQVFAKSLEKELMAKYPNSVTIKSIERKSTFFSYLAGGGFGYKVKELHIFSHAFGPGLALGYGDPRIAQERQNFFTNKLDAYYSQNKPGELYDDIITLEKGILFVDDLQGASASVKTAIRGIFSASDAFVKLWGCNSAVENWYYDSEDAYWGALNYKNNPKPSIAKTMAQFCDVVAYGASSGSHIEVRDGTNWITSEAYKTRHGKYPSGMLPHRLEPDKGGYDAYNP